MGLTESAGYFILAFYALIAVSVIGAIYALVYSGIKKKQGDEAALRAHKMASRIVVDLVIVIVALGVILWMADKFA